MVFIILVSKIFCEPPKISCDDVLLILDPKLWSCPSSRPVGKGASGIAYKIESKLRSDVTYIIKIQSVSQKSLLEKALQEIDIIRSILHKNVISVVNSFREKNNMFTILEYAEYGSLSSVIKSDPEAFKDPRLVMKIFLDILKGVQAVHQAGYIHSDLKTANVVVTKNLIPKVIDFDIAVSAQLQCENIQGSPLYMDPRLIVLRDVKYDQFTDIYSLGILLYAMVNNDLPIFSDSRSIKQLVEKLKVGEIYFRDGIEVHIAYAINWATQMNWKDRPSVDALITFVNSYLKSTGPEKFINATTVSNTAVKKMSKYGVSEVKQEILKEARDKYMTESVLMNEKAYYAKGYADQPVGGNSIVISNMEDLKNKNIDLNSGIEIADQNAYYDVIYEPIPIPEKKKKRQLLEQKKEISQQAEDAFDKNSFNFYLISSAFILTVLLSSLYVVFNKKRKLSKTLSKELSPAEIVKQEASQGV